MANIHLVYSVERCLQLTFWIVQYIDTVRNSSGTISVYQPSCRPITFQYRHSDVNHHEQSHRKTPDFWTTVAATLSFCGSDHGYCQASSDTPYFSILLHVELSAALFPLHYMTCCSQTVQCTSTSLDKSHPTASYYIPKDGLWQHRT